MTQHQPIKSDDAALFEQTIVRPVWRDSLKERIETGSLLLGGKQELLPETIAAAFAARDIEPFTIEATPIFWRRLKSDDDQIISMVIKKCNNRVAAARRLVKFSVLTICTLVGTAPLLSDYAEGISKFALLVSSGSLVFIGAWHQVWDRQLALHRFANWYGRRILDAIIKEYGLHAKFRSVALVFGQDGIRRRIS